MSHIAPAQTIIADFSEPTQPTIFQTTNDFDRDSENDLETKLNSLETEKEENSRQIEFIQPIEMSPNFSTCLSPVQEENDGQEQYEETIMVDIEENRKFWETNLVDALQGNRRRSTVMRNIVNKGFFLSIYFYIINTKAKKKKVENQKKKKRRVCSYFISPHFSPLSFI